MKIAKAIEVLESLKNFTENNRHNYSIYSDNSDTALIDIEALDIAIECLKERNCKNKEFKSLYFKPKYKLFSYEKYLNDIINGLDLCIRKHENKEYILENEYCIVKLSSDMVEVLIFDRDNETLINKINKYFK